MQAGLFLLFVTPLLFYPGSQDAFRLPKLLFATVVVSFLLLLFTLRVARGTAPGLRFSPAHLPFFLLFAVSALTFPWFADLHPNIRVPYLWGVAFGSFLLVASLDRSHQVRSASFILLLGGTLIALYGLLQYVGIDLPIYQGKGAVRVHTFPLGRGGTPFSTLGNPSFLGEYLAGTLPFAFASLFAVQGRSRRIILAAFSVLMVVVLLLTQARAAWIGFAAGGGFLLWNAHHLGLKRPKVVLLATLATGAFLLILSRGCVPGAGRGWDKLTQTVALDEGSVGARLFWWRVTLEMITGHPLLGVGVGQFREVYPMYQKAFFEDPRNLRFAKFTQTDAPLEAPHNQYLQLTAEMGLVGLGLFLGLVVALFWMGLSALRMVKEEEKPFLLGSLAGVVALLADGFFSYPLEIPSSLLLFSFLAGLIVAVAHLGQESEAGKRKTEGGRRAKERLLVLLLGALTLFSFLHLASLIKVSASSLHLHRGTEQFLKGDPAGAAAFFERALEVNPRDPELHLALASAYAALGRTKEALHLAESGKGGFSAPGLSRFLGSLRYDLGDYQGAEAEYREGIAIFPGFAPLHASYGALLARMRRDAEALSRLDRARALDPLYPDTYHYLGHLYHLQGRPKESLAAFREFLRLAPGDDPRRGLDEELMGRLAQRLGS